MGLNEYIRAHPEVKNGAMVTLKSANDDAGIGQELHRIMGAQRKRANRAARAQSCLRPSRLPCPSRRLPLTAIHRARGPHATRPLRAGLPDDKPVNHRELNFRYVSNVYVPRQQAAMQADQERIDEEAAERMIAQLDQDRIDGARAFSSSARPALAPLQQKPRPTPCCRACCGG